MRLGRKCAIPPVPKTFVNLDTGKAKELERKHQDLLNFKVKFLNFEHPENSIFERRNFTTI